jgi:hypothetical protein
MSKEQSVKPFYEKTWFIITTAVIFFTIIAQLIPHKDDAIPEKSFKQMTVSEKSNFIKTFVINRKPAIKEIIEDRVKQKLKAPSQASFLDEITFKEYDVESLKLIAQGKVDAPNSFGVKLRITYTALFTIANEEGYIDVIEIKIEE